MNYQVLKLVIDVQELKLREIKLKNRVGSY